MKAIPFNLTGVHMVNNVSQHLLKLTLIMENDSFQHIEGCVTIDRQLVDDRWVFTLTSDLKFSTQAKDTAAPTPKVPTTPKIDIKNDMEMVDKILSKVTAVEKELVAAQEKKP